MNEDYKVRLEKRIKELEEERERLLRLIDELRAENQRLSLVAEY